VGEGLVQGSKMTVLVRQTRMLAACLVVIVILTSFGGLTANAQHRSRRRNGQHSKLKGALIGAAAGTIGGAIIGRGKGALIGGGLGAGTGYLIQRHRNRRRHRHYYRRH
jgi:osmotically inducible lipoprotein OsmB